MYVQEKPTLFYANKNKANQCPSVNNCNAYPSTISSTIIFYLIQIPIEIFFSYSLTYSHIGIFYEQIFLADDDVLKMVHKTVLIMNNEEVPFTIVI